VEAVATAAWEWLAAAGGSVALGLIVALAVGINALTVLFLGSAVIVLERFARAARRPLVMVLVAIAVALVGGVIATSLAGPEAISEAGGFAPAWGVRVGAIAIVLLGGVTVFALRRRVGDVGRAAALAALDDAEHVAASVTLNREGMAELRAGCDRLGLGYIPSVANFLTIDLGRAAASIYEALLRDGCITRPVANYGLPNHLRVTIGRQAENRRFLASLERVLAIR